MRASFLRILGLSALCFTAPVRADAENYAPAADVIQARWDTRSIVFAYSGNTTGYSCTALADKIRTIVIAVGGHPDTRASATGCNNRTARVIRVDIVTAMPRPVAEPKAPQVIEREKLLERFGVRQEFPGQFPARQQRVSVTSKAGVRFAPGDCELLSQLRAQLLPQLGVKADRDRTICTPHRLSSAAPRLNVTALLPSKDALITGQSDAVTQ